MRVLVACEFSGAVRDAFRNLGHDAWSCDLEGVEPEGKWKHKHIIGDCRSILHWNWDLLIAHPPCTYLCNSGVRWLWDDESRWDRMWEATEFFLELLNCPIPQRAIENPIMHRYAKSEIVFEPDQIIQPYYFGELESKATCLWLRNLPRLRRTNFVYEGIKESVHRAKPSPDRHKERSRTFPKVAEAFASQWGSL